MKPNNHKIKYAVLLVLVVLFGCSKDKEEIPQTLYYCQCVNSTGSVSIEATDSTYAYAVQICDARSTNMVRPYPCRILDRSETKNLYACVCPQLAPPFRIPTVIEGKDSAMRYCNQYIDQLQLFSPTVKVNCYLAR